MYIALAIFKIAIGFTILLFAYKWFLYFLRKRNKLSEPDQGSPQCEIGDGLVHVNNLPDKLPSIEVKQLANGQLTSTATVEVANRVAEFALLDNTNELEIQFGAQNLWKKW